MATLASLVDRTRRFVRDYPDLDQLTASCTSTATTLTVTDTAKYSVNQRFEVDYETMIVRALTNATTLTVSRAAYGSTAAVHQGPGASGALASVLKSPSYFFSDYSDAINMAVDACFPLIYKEVNDESLTASANTFEYTIPNMPSDSMPVQYISQVFVKWTGDTQYRVKKDWKVIRGATPKLVFFTDEVGTIRIRGYGGFPHLSATSDTLDTQFPVRAERLLTMYAANYLLMTGEASRVRHDSGVIDAREQASRVGSSSAAANAMLQRFQLHLANLAMKPLPVQAVPTF